MKFSSTEEFQIKAHQCFNRIFELLMQVDGVVKEGAEREEANGNHGEMSQLRDWVEEVILQCHLAWQYHRLSKGPDSRNTWDAVENVSNQDNSAD
ncbi:MAG: hypothetical protein RDU20_07730 [Desulfomonilaceae bacterium]|nr:hypothetical protein [Desulfomonilaceae bacterium]